MLELQQDILNRAGSRKAVDPAMWLDIYADRGPSAKLDQKFDWVGVNDPDVASDVNIDFDRRPGSITLSPGNLVEPTSIFIKPVWQNIKAGDYRSTVEYGGIIYRVSGGIQRSTDGINFTQVLSGTVQRIAYSPSKGFIAMGLSGGVYYTYTSSNGINWSIAGGLFFSGGNIVGLGAGNSKFFMMTNGGKVYNSTDAVTWNYLYGVGTTGYGMGVAGANVILHGTQASAYSTDEGASFTAMAIPNGFTMSVSKYAGGLWLVRGNAGQLYTSATGAAWKLIQTPAQGSFVAFNHIDGVYFASTDKNDFLQSADAVIWEVGSSAGTIGPLGQMYKIGSAYMMGLAAGMFQRPLDYTPVKSWVSKWQGRVIDHYHHKFSWKGRKYVHDSYEYVTDIDQPGQIFKFKSNATIVANKLVILAKHSGNIFPGWYARFLDEKGNQIGKQITFSVNVSDWSSITVVGFGASLIRSRSYSLEVGYSKPDIHAMGGAQGGVATYAATISVGAFTVLKSPWHIRVSGQDGFSLGGNEGYADAGSLVRSLDVNQVPITDGAIELIDIVPAGTTAKLSLWHTADPVVAAAAGTANLTFFGTYDTIFAQTQTLPADRYWKIKIELTSNSSNDIAPEIGKVGVGFRLSPVVIGTHSTTLGTEYYTAFPMPWQLPLMPKTYKRLRKGGVKALADVRISPAQLKTKIATSMVGKATATFVADRHIDALMSKKLLGAEVVIRFGYADIESSVDVYAGTVLDMSYASGKYTLIIQDPLDLKDVKIPNVKHPSWSGTKAYKIGDTIISGTSAWSALVANTNILPGSDNVTWKKTGAIWMPVDYTSGTNGGVEWHVADIIIDIFTNRINVQTNRIDLDSIVNAKTRFPNRTASRIIEKPTSADAMLAELAYILEAQFVMRKGKISLVVEPLSTDMPIEIITDSDISEKVHYKRGWSDLKNGAITLTAWDGLGNNTSNFADGEAVFDAQSIDDYKVVVMNEFRDKWNVPLSELDLISSDYLARHKDGRRIIQCESNMRLLRLEPGDLVMFESNELPGGDPGPHRMIMMAKDTHWDRQRLNMTLWGA